MNNRVLIYRSPLRKLDTSSNQLRASLDKVCASGKLLSFRLAGTGTGCGQSTAGGVGLLAHPLKISAKIIDASKRLVPSFPSVNETLCIAPLLLTILGLKGLRTSGVVLAQFSDVLPVQGGGILVARDEDPDACGYRTRRLHPRSHLVSSSFQRVTPRLDCLRHSPRNRYAPERQENDVHPDSLPRQFLFHHQLSKPQCGYQIW